MVTQIEAQDISVIYNPTTIDDMQQSYPLLDWLAYVQMLGAPVDGSALIVNTELELFENLQAILESTPLETVKDYLRLQHLLLSDELLSEDVQEATFPYRQAVTGVEQQEPTEEEVLIQVNQWMGDAVGQVYVAEFFPPTARDQIIALVDDVIAAFRLRLEANAWMSPETKEKAFEKLDAMRLKVGYPEAWRNYDAVEIGDSYFETSHNAYVVESNRIMAQAGQPVDKEEWFIPPQVVNAFYNPVNNEIVFPAAILQPPFFDPDADPASNYGAIGFVIGHEITHGFDLQGSQFDADGNFVNWWTEGDNAAFRALNDEVVAQYGAVEVLPGQNVDGQLTVTENVADLGGLQVAFDALQLALAAGGDPGPIDGLTQQQRFFIAAASAWRQVIREEFLVTLLTVDVHAPAEVRGTLPLRNMDAFYEAFAIEPGDAMYLPPEERIVVW
jgi:putative endopeptidase